MIVIYIYDWSSKFAVMGYYLFLFAEIELILGT
jgi:hypothetical protein